MEYNKVLNEKLFESSVKYDKYFFLIINNNKNQKTTQKLTLSNWFTSGDIDLSRSHNQLLIRQFR